MVLSGVALWVPPRASSQRTTERYLGSWRLAPCRGFGLWGTHEFRVCFAVLFLGLDHSFRGGDFFEGGRVPQVHGPAARTGQIVAVGRKSDARSLALVPV